MTTINEIDVNPIHGDCFGDWGLAAPFSPASANAEIESWQPSPFRREECSRVEEESRDDRVIWAQFNRSSLKKWFSENA